MVCLFVFVQPSLYHVAVVLLVVGYASFCAFQDHFVHFFYACVCLWVVLSPPPTLMYQGKCLLNNVHTFCFFVLLARTQSIVVLLLVFVIYL